ncbi:arginine deiminase [Bacillus solimangrovi]|uniref:Arginine deiminase n=1 Tax=Bacillus solimangrovi TaxID=1305675 RepID=A0A1E5LIG4_9BACI|nr:arginine deiminase [Bacillus solimangrovi]OEH93867.1 arginine deiminase [Bacillus solimangrovi]
MKYPVHITSEIGELKTVILHRPGKEVENLTPEYLKRLLFDDIPFLPAIQKEHDYFANALRNRGVEVLYLTTLMEEALNSNEIREKFVDQILTESKSNINGAWKNLRAYLLSGSTKELVEKVMSGVLKTDIPSEKKIHLYELMSDHYPFYLDPMPNLYFTRDPAAAIGNGVSINRMQERARKRESIFMDYIMNYHPRFANHQIPKWFTRDNRFAMEGGDQLVLSKDTLAIGVSARTSPQAIEQLAIQLFKYQDQFTKVLVVEIPKSRAFMHLDTVFTMVDHNKFTIHPAIQGPDGNMRIFTLEKGEQENRVKITEGNNFSEALKAVLNLDEIILIPCGGGDPIASAREQWNDGSNTLAISPGVVITYDRNYVSNEVLRNHGIEVIEVQSSELSRGRGGPRCMSMPIYREDI